MRSLHVWTERDVEFAAKIPSLSFVTQRVWLHSEPCITYVNIFLSVLRTFLSSGLKGKKKKKLGPTLSEGTIWCHR